MSTANSLVLYQNETIGTGIRHSPPRASEFLIQMMVGGDADLRKALGRRDIAEARAAAYGAALANRPSARPLSFLRVIGSV